MEGNLLPTAIDALERRNREFADLRAESERLTWLLSLEGRKALYWAVENGEPFTREDIDREMGK